MAGMVLSIYYLRGVSWASHSCEMRYRDCPSHCILQIRPSVVRCLSMVTWWGNWDINPGILASQLIFVSSTLQCVGESLLLLNYSSFLGRATSHCHPGDMAVSLMGRFWLARSILPFMWLCLARWWTGRWAGQGKGRQFSLLECNEQKLH